MGVKCVSMSSLLQVTSDTVEGALQLVSQERTSRVSEASIGLNLGNESQSITQPMDVDGQQAKVSQVCGGLFFSP